MSRETIADVALIEIVEKTTDTERNGGAGLVVPNEVRINGQAVLVPASAPITVHELNKGEAVQVTLTLFARVKIDRETAPKVRRLWNKDHELVHTFADGESADVFPIDHPVALFLYGAAWANERVYMTCDGEGRREVQSWVIEMPTTSTVYGPPDESDRSVMIVKWAEVEA